MLREFDDRSPKRFPTDAELATLEHLSTAPRSADRRLALAAILAASVLIVSLLLLV